MHPRRWVWGKWARPERAQALTSFALPQNSVLFEIKANMDFTTLTGRHPEELPRRRSLRAFPACVHGGIVLFLIFAAVDDKFVVLHAPVEGHPGQRTLGARPALSADAWELAQKRFDAGQY